MATTELPVPRYRLPSEDDDVFLITASPVNFNTASSMSGDRGLKRRRLHSEDDDDVFFRPRARLDSAYTPQFPRARLPSDSDTSCFAFYPSRVRHPEERRPLLLPRLLSSSSVQLNSSQYTVDDSQDPAFKTPAIRPRRRRTRISTADGSSLVPNSSGSQLLSDPPRIIRAPVGWASPSISPLPCDSMADMRFRLQNQISSLSSISDWCFSPPEKTSNPATSSPVKTTSTRVPTTSSPITRTSTHTAYPSLSTPHTSGSGQEAPENLARSILSEELRSDSGISSLPSFDAGQVCFSKYRETFEEKLLDVMVNILNTVDPLPLELPSVTCYQTRPDSSAITLPSITDVFTNPEDSKISSQHVTYLPDEHRYLDFSPSYDMFPAPTPAPSPASDDSQSPAVIVPSPVDKSRLSTSSSDDALTQAKTVPAKTPTTRSTQCTVCHKVLASAANLRTHMRIHTGDRPFVCPFCVKDFNDRTAWRRHKRLHTGKPFTCLHCPKSFVTKSMLREHVERHHSS